MAAEGDLPSIAQRILAKYKTERIFLLSGQQGAGKTTLIKHFCILLGSNDRFTSPTYSIMNEYQSPAGTIYHIDLYRLASLEEALAAGIGEALDSGNYCFVEWPELIEEMAGEDAVSIRIEAEGSNRKISAGRQK
jgi:tRNA threonylcarbamoyladenosine biosynthesis protein TsaE